MKINLFFYGSLMEWPPYERFIVKKVPAIVRGFMWRFNGLFPSLVLHKKKENEWVKGLYVEYDFKDDAVEFDWFMHDLFQWESSSPADKKNSAYHLVTARVLRKDKVWSNAEVFICNQTYPHNDRFLTREKIPNGDYIKWRDANRGKSH